MEHSTQAAGAWQLKPFMEQMSNIGSEVCRALSWRKKGNDDYSKMAFFRSLELIDLTIDSKPTIPQLKELCRLREFWIDYFMYDNQYSFTAEYWEKYFNQIGYAWAMRKNNL